MSVIDCLINYGIGIVKSLSHVQLFVTPWTVAHQAPLSMGFSRQENWSGLPFPPPGDLPYPGIDPHLQCLLRCRFFTIVPPGKPSILNVQCGKSFI